jgi:CheY-like chemotaxis protein
MDIEDNDITIFQGKKILIVEDDFFNAQYLNEILEETGIETNLSETGESAIDKVKSGLQFDLILMDIRLPGIDGYTTTKLILEMHPDMKIIAQTAFASSLDMKKAYEAGCTDYIAKPVGRDTLFSKMLKIF